MHETVDGTLELGTREGFGQAVSKLILGLDVFELNDPFLSLVLDVADDVQVVAERGSRRVGGAHGHCGLAVAEDFNLLGVVLKTQVAVDESQVGGDTHSFVDADSLGLRDGADRSPHDLAGSVYHAAVDQDEDADLGDALVVVRVGVDRGAELVSASSGSVELDAPRSRLVQVLDCAVCRLDVLLGGTRASSDAVSATSGRPVRAMCVSAPLRVASIFWSVLSAPPGGGGTGGPNCLLGLGVRTRWVCSPMRRFSWSISILRCCVIVVSPVARSCWISSPLKEKGSPGSVTVIW